MKSYCITNCAGHPIDTDDNNLKTKIMFKRAKVVMLTTNQQAPITLGDNLNVNIPGIIRGTNYHLYIITDWSKEHCRKIIASTDNLNLPQPSTSFINKYIEEYNKGNIITDVMVEYDESIVHHPDINPLQTIKVNSKDNTITIKRVKDTWTRNEIIALFNKLHTEEGIDFDFTNWIKTHL